MASTRGERLRAARARKFKSARLAAKALNMPVSTYGAHERAEAPGGRDYGPEDAKKYARRFGVSPEWLLTGRLLPGEEAPDGIAPEPDEPAVPKVRVIGYVGAGAEAHFYAVDPGDLDEVDAPEGATDDTVAVEIRGDSMGSFFDRWIVFYDDVHRPVTLDLVGKICVVGLEDGRVLIKKLQTSRQQGLFTLLSQTEPPISDVVVEWAAKVRCIVSR
jgi:phage repressor protein C with HTH and peptisase S24 domain